MTLSGIQYIHTQKRTSTLERTQKGRTPLTCKHLFRTHSPVLIPTNPYFVSHDAAEAVHWATSIYSLTGQKEDGGFPGASTQSHSCMCTHERTTLTGSLLLANVHSHLCTNTRALSCTHTNTHTHTHTHTHKRSGSVDGSGHICVVSITCTDGPAADGAFNI